MAKDRTGIVLAMLMTCRVIAIFAYLCADYKIIRRYHVDYSRYYNEGELNIYIHSDLFEPT